MENITAKTDLLNLSLDVSSTPEIEFVKRDAAAPVVPQWSAVGQPNGFQLQLEAALPYEALSKVANGYLDGKRFEISEGLIKQYIIVQGCRLYGIANERLMIEVPFGGTFRGTILLQGQPVYDQKTRRIEIINLDYELQTSSLLLRTASWLFDNRILAEIKKYTAIDLSQYYQSAGTAVEGLINRSWSKGIEGSGALTEITLTSVHALPQHLLIRSHCTGRLRITITEAML